MVTHSQKYNIDKMFLCLWVDIVFSIYFSFTELTLWWDTRHSYFLFVLLHNWERLKLFPRRLSLKFGLIPLYPPQYITDLLIFITESKKRRKRGISRKMFRYTGERDFGSHEEWWPKRALSISHALKKAFLKFSLTV